MDIKSNANFESVEVQVNGTTLAAGEALVGQGAGSPAVADSTHKEWETADGSGVDVRDLTQAIRREGDMGTQGNITDSSGNIPGTINSTTILRTLYAKKSNADGTFTTHWHHPENTLCRGVIGDSTVEANALNCAASNGWPVTQQGFVWQINIIGINRPTDGVSTNTTPEYTISHRNSTNNTVLNSWVVNIAAGTSSLAPVVDLRTNVNSVGEHLSTVVASPGSHFTLEMTNANGTVDFTTGMELLVTGAMVRRGNVV